MLPLIPPLIIAHRGDKKNAPENTIRAFREALRLRVDAIELDYHTSKNGHLVVIHDDCLNRTTNAGEVFGRTMYVRDMTIKQIKRLDAGKWRSAKFKGASVPTLEQALTCIQKKAFTFIEHKAGKAKDLVKLLKKNDWLNEVVVISFDWDFIKEVNKLAPHMKRGTGANGPPEDRPLTEEQKFLSEKYLNKIKNIGAKFVGWDNHVTAESIQMAHKKGLRVYIYTIDDLLEAKELIALGVDGIVTNDPERMTESLH